MDHDGQLDIFEAQTDYFCPVFAPFMPPVSQTHALKILGIIAYFSAMFENIPVPIHTFYAKQIEQLYFELSPELERELFETYIYTDVQGEKRGDFCLVQEYEETCRMCNIHLSCIPGLIPALEDNECLICYEPLVHHNKSRPPKRTSQQLRSTSKKSDLSQRAVLHL